MSENFPPIQGICSASPADRIRIGTYLVLPNFATRRGLQFCRRVITGQTSAALLKWVDVLCELDFDKERIMPESAIQPVRVGFDQGATDAPAIVEGAVVSTDEAPTPEDAPAYRLGNLLSLANAGKWRGHAFKGMVVSRAALLQPGVELRRLLDLNAIFPATLAELVEWESKYGETSQTSDKREEQIRVLQRNLQKRMRAASPDSARVRLLAELIREWSDIENQCRMRWTGEFGGLMGKTEEQVRRYYLDRESDLRTLGRKEDIYREQMSAVAEPLLIATAGMSMDIAPIHDFLGSTAHQWNSRNPKEWQVLDWLPQLQYKLLHQERQSKSHFLRATVWVFEQWWKFLIAVATVLATALVVNYFKARGINFK